MSCSPSVTSKRIFRSVPRWTLPGLTSPPMRMRVPGAICFVSTSLGELKNTIEPLSAFSTRPTATARTPIEPPIRTSRRCLRVIAMVSAFEPQTFYHIIDLPQLVRVARQRALGIAGGRHGLVAVAEHDIGAQEALPTLDVAAVLLQFVRQPRDHAADHRGAVLLAHLLRGRDLARIGAGRGGNGRRRAGHARDRRLDRVG